MLSKNQLRKKLLYKPLKKMALSTAYIDANIKCAFIFGQMEQPDNVKRLKR